MWRNVARFLTIAVCLIALESNAQPGVDSSATASQSAGPANVVFIILDSLRADRVNAVRNSVPLTPYLMGVAAQGARFTNAHAPGVWTLPAMSSVFTSVSPDTHGILLGGNKLLPSFETMASYLKQAGYSTLAVQTNGNLEHPSGIDQGFDQYDLVSDILRGADAAAVTAHALQITQAVTQPFFLYIHYTGPHVPYTPLEPYGTMLGYPDPMLDPAERAIVEDFIPYFYDQIDYTMGLKPTREFTPLSPVGEEAVGTLFDVEVRYHDDQLGVFMDALDLRYPNTVYIITADHGEHLFEHGYLGHGTTMYEPLVRVQVVMKGPGVPAGTTIDSNVSTLDLLPTIASLLALPARDPWQGTSLFGPRDPQGPTFAYTAGADTTHLAPLAMVKLGSMKLIVNRQTQEEKLYDVSTDPGETTNLASAHPEEAAQLSTLLATHLEQGARTRAPSGAIGAVPGSWVEEDTSVTLTAPGSGVYRWFKDGAPIEEDAPHVTGSTGPALSITFVSAGDAGAYECLYDNGNKTYVMSQPFVLSVFPADSLPVLSPAGLALLGIGLMAAGAFSRRRSR